MVKYVGFSNGEVLIDLNMMSFDNWRDNVAEEIHEHLRKYPEVKDSNQFPLMRCHIHRQRRVLMNAPFFVPKLYPK